LIEKKYIYERTGALEIKNIKDIQFIGAMLPPGGGNNMVDPRFLSLFGVFCIMFPSRENVERIYNQIFKSHLIPFDAPL
jgi:dynein heavy chain